MGILSLTEAESGVCTCATPGCRQEGGEGVWGRFCGPCADNLARIRAEYEAEKEQRKARWASTQNGLRSVSRGPKCTTIGCDEPRPSGRMLCDVCEAMGVDVDEAA